MTAYVQLHLDTVTIGRLCKLGYLHPKDRDPTVLRHAVTAALADRLAPAPDASIRDDWR